MEIKKEMNGTTMIMHLSGRLDAVTAVDLDKALSASLSNVKDLVFDLADLEYIASAGLRSLLAAQKRMARQGSMVLKNVTEEVRDVLDMTGFSDFLTIE